MSKNLGPFMPLYVDDFIGGTMSFANDELGAYLMLLIYQWNNEAIENDNEAIERISKTKIERLKRVLNKFELTEKGLVNKKCAEIRLERERYINGKSSAGRLGADKRWHNHGNAMAKPLDMLCNPSPSPSPYPIPTTPIPTKIKKSISSSADDGCSIDKNFEMFWSAYPKKIGKQAAYKSWKKAKSKPAVDKIIEAVNQQKKTEQWQKDNGQFIPHPQTWINQGRWDDSVSTEIHKPKYFED
jgi:uncharacterized protein YdaU (DUF1376 family)